MDENKRIVLDDIGYLIQACCETCVHSDLSPDGWGYCGAHEYKHLKHSEDSSFLSVHRLGSCLQWERDENKIAGLGLHAFEDFMSRVAPTTPAPGPLDSLTFVSQDGTDVSWSVLKERAKTTRVAFQVPDSVNHLTFILGPDIFPDSYRLCWMTPEEKEGGPDAYLDNRCRSSDPDDFLSRIEELA